MKKIKNLTLKTAIKQRMDELLMSLIRQSEEGIIDLPIWPKFCWVCGHKFWGNRLYVINLNPEKGEGAGPRYVHKQCGEAEGYKPLWLPINKPVRMYNRKTGR